MMRFVDGRFVELSVVGCARFLVGGGLPSIAKGAALDYLLQADHRQAGVLAL